MIQDGVMFVCFLLAFTALIAVVEKKIGGKFFKYVPGIVLIYIGAALMKTFGVFSDSESVESAYSTIRALLLPAMLMLMLLQCDMRKIIRLGPKMLLTFLRLHSALLEGSRLLTF